MKRLSILLLILTILAGGISIFNFSNQKDKVITKTNNVTDVQKATEERSDTSISQQDITASNSDGEEDTGQIALGTDKSIKTQNETKEEESNKTTTEANDTIVTQNETEEENLELDISQEELIRTNSQGAVDIAILFTSVLEDYSRNLEFEVMLNTHSVDLEAIDFKKATVLRTSEGLEISEELEWKILNGGGHHITGVITSPKEFNGEKVIKESTEYIELEMKDIDGVLSRKFKWDREVLKHMTIID